jgi:hypothetical protein
MKKSIILIGLSVVLFSCSKTNTPTFTPTSSTGTAQFTGTIYKVQATTAPVPAQGVQVTVVVPNSQLYPLSYSATGSTTYSGTTDANGNFNIAVTTNSNGVNATVYISNTSGTYDPLNGTQSNFRGTTTSLTFTTGVPVNYNYTENQTNTTGTTVTGTATVMGTVYITYIKQDGASYVDSNYGLANQLVTLNFYVDPVTNVVKTYTVNTDANGNYTIQVTTTNPGGNYPDMGTLMTYDLSHSKDTIKTGGVQVAGKPGHYTGTMNQSLTVNPLGINQISSGNKLYYNNFIPN